MYKAPGYPNLNQGIVDAVSDKIDRTIAACGTAAMPGISLDLSTLTYAPFSCGRSDCPVCGQKFSESHKLKQGRWLPRADYLYKNAGVRHIVYTFPEGITQRLQKLIIDDPALVHKFIADTRRGIIRSMKVKGLDMSRGLMAVHWFGDKHPERFRPHFHAITGGGYIPAFDLMKLKLSWKAVIQRAVNRLIPGTTFDWDSQDLPVIHTAFVGQDLLDSETLDPKILHWIGYATRSTATDDNRKSMGDYWWGWFRAFQFRFRTLLTWGKWPVLQNSYIPTAVYIPVTAERVRAEAVHPDPDYPLKSVPDEFMAPDIDILKKLYAAAEIAKSGGSVTFLMPVEGLQEAWRIRSIMAPGIQSAIVDLVMAHEQNAREAHGVNPWVSEEYIINSLDLYADYVLRVDLVSYTDLLTYIKRG